MAADRPALPSPRLSPDEVNWLCRGGRWCEPVVGAPGGGTDLVWATAAGVSAWRRGELLQTTDGLHWVATDVGPQVLDLSTGQLRPAEPDVSSPRVTTGAKVAGSFYEASGGPLMATTAGTRSQLPMPPQKVTWHWLLTTPAAFEWKAERWVAPDPADAQLDGGIQGVLGNDRIGLWAWTQHTVFHRDHDNTWTAWKCGDQVRGLTTDAEGQVWIAGYAGLLGSFANGRWTRVSQPLSSVRAMTIGADHTLYVANDYELAIRSPSGAWQVEQMSGTSLALLANGTLVTNGRGLAVRLPDGQWLQSRAAGPDLGSLAVAPDGRAWAGGRHAFVESWNGTCWTEDTALKEHLATALTEIYCRDGLPNFTPAQCTKMLGGKGDDTRDAFVAALVPADDGALWAAVHGVPPELSLQRKVGDTWQTIALPKDTEMRKLWKSSGSLWLATQPIDSVGDSGLGIHRFTKGNWAKVWAQNPSQPHRLEVFTGNEKQGLFIGGNDGQLIKVLNGREALLSVPVAENVKDLAVGAKTLFVLFDSGVWSRPLAGTQWTALTGGDAPFEFDRKNPLAQFHRPLPAQLWLGRTGELWVAGFDGFSRWTGTTWVTERLADRGNTVLGGFDHPDWAAGYGGLVWPAALANTLKSTSALPAVDSAPAPGVKAASVSVTPIDGTVRHWRACSDASGVIGMGEQSGSHVLHWFRAGQRDVSLLQSTESEDWSRQACSRAGVLFVAGHKLWLADASGHAPRALLPADRIDHVMLNAQLALVAIGSDLQAIELQTGKTRWKIHRETPIGLQHLDDSTLITSGDEAVSLVDGASHRPSRATGSWRLALEAVSLVDGTSHRLGKPASSTTVFTQGVLYFWEMPPSIPIEQLTLVSVDVAHGTRREYVTVKFKDTFDFAASDGHAGAFRKKTIEWVDVPAFTPLPEKWLSTDGTHAYTFEHGLLAVHPLFQLPKAER